MRFLVDMTCLFYFCERNIFTYLVNIFLNLSCREFQYKILPNANDSYLVFKNPGGLMPHLTTSPPHPVDTHVMWYTQGANISFLQDGKIARVESTRKGALANWHERSMNSTLHPHTFTLFLVTILMHNIIHVYHTNCIINKNKVIRPLI